MAWNAMGGLDWAALDTVIDWLQIDDADALITDLIYLRDNRDA